MQLHKLGARKAGKAGKAYRVLFCPPPPQPQKGRVRLNHAIFVAVSELILQTRGGSAPRDLLGLRVPNSGYTGDELWFNVSGTEESVDE